MSFTADLSPDDRYVSLPALLDSGLAARISRRVGGPLRVGRSTAVMGLASRLWAVTVVSAVRTGAVVDPAALVARDDDGSVVLGVRPDVGWRRPAPDRLADTVSDVVLAVLAPLVESTALSPRLLWGNVAGSLHAVPLVHDEPRARPLVDDLLARAPLAGELDPTGRRRTCCLFYLVPGAGLCGDCVLSHVPAR